MADLIIDATTSTLSGIQNYTNITVRNGGILYVTDYVGTDPAGTLELNATGTILVDATSQINADYRGFRGGQSTAGNGEGPGAGSGGGFSGSGAGYGGAGGGVSWPPGPTYGTTSGSDIAKGSGGGCSVYFSSYGRGGDGGGYIKLTAPTITISGTISANGEGGTTGSGQHGSGGGSGGGVYINGTNVTISGIIRTNGGNGSAACCGSPRYGGDGGGGGRIKIFYSTLNTTGANIASNAGGGGAGSGAANGAPGNNGTIYYLQTTGSASFSSIPSGARIWIDNVDQGVNTPYTISGIPIGTHSYKLTRAGYIDATGSFSVSSGSTTTVPTVTLISAFNAFLIAGD